jgi:hypothetical protein
VVQHIGQLPSAVQRPLGDSLDQHLVGVMSGELGTAQDPAESRAAVLGGDRGALATGEVTLVHEGVEPARGTPSGGQLAGVSQ